LSLPPRLLGEPRRSVRTMRWSNALMSLTLAACAGAPREHSEPAASPGAQHEPARAATSGAPAPAAASGGARWYAAARAAHAAADAAHDPAAESGALDRLASAAASEPPPEIAAPDAIALRQDLYGRAVQLALDIHQIPRASQLLEQASKLPPQPGPFHRQLTILAGRTSAAAGDPHAAELRYREA